MAEPTPDKIDDIRRQWAEAAPDLDTSPVEVLGRVYRIANLAGRRISELFEAHGLDRGEFDVAATLYRSGVPHELTPTELYRELMISSGGLTHRLKRLEAQGLVERARSAEDGRSFRVRLTAKGRETVLRAYAEDLALEARLLEGLSPAEAAELQRLLRRLHAVVEENAA